jgi:MurNAc alpha-1-phosphate uridylyltransferase
MILAAGRGTRMGSLTEERPKPLLEVRDRAIIDYVFDRLIAAGVRRVVVNLHHLAGMLRDHLARRGDVEIAFSDESDGLMNTGGGVAKALPLLGEAPFYVVNGDVLWFDAMDDSLRAIAARFDPDAMDGLLLLQPLVGAIGYDGVGDFLMASDGALRRRPEREIAPFVFSGVQLLRPGLFDRCPANAFSINQLYDRAIKANRLFGMRHEGEWMELNRPEGLRAAEAVLRQ